MSNSIYYIAWKMITELGIYLKKQTLEKNPNPQRRLNKHK